MCRQCLHKPIFIPKIDLDLQNQIRNDMGELYEKAKAEQMKEGNIITKKLVRFTYGNTFELAPDTDSIRIWKMQFSLNDGKENIGRYI